MDEMINTNNYDTLLIAFAREYRRLHGNTPIEIIIVGGGSVLINYGFRDMTHDFDIDSSAPRALKDVIINVANKYGLPEDWMNEDFRFTKSYSPKIRFISTPYRTLNNGVIEIRTVSSEYLIAMKMQSDREFSHDIPDIVGIIKCELDKGNRITYEKIHNAGVYLYESGFNPSDSLIERVKNFTKMDVSELNIIYEQTVYKSGIIKERIQDKNNVLNRERLKELAKNEEFKIKDL